jgi:hypothetical protein
VTRTTVKDSFLQVTPEEDAVIRNYRIDLPWFLRWAQRNLEIRPTTWLMVDSLEDNAKKHRLLLNAKPNTLKMLAFTATSTLEALQKSVSLLIRSFDNKSISMRSATAAMRKFSLIVIDYVETTLNKLKGPVLIKVWQAALSHIHHKQSGSQRQTEKHLGLHL